MKRQGDDFVLPTKKKKDKEKKKKKKDQEENDKDDKEEDNENGDKEKVNPVSVDEMELNHIFQIVESAMQSFLWPIEQMLMTFVNKPEDQDE